MILAFTGHRPDKLGGYGWSSLQRDVRAAVREALHQLKPAGCISGMALGVDQWAAEVCNDLGIPWCAAVPFPGQELKWPVESRVRYAELLRTAAEVRVLHGSGYQPWKLHARNEWMVDNSDGLLAVWDGSEGGTAHCVDYALRAGRAWGADMWRIDPKGIDPKEIER